MITKLSSYNCVDLSTLVDISTGKTPSRANLNYWGFGKNWLSIADMKGDMEVCDTKEQITELAIKETGIKIVPKGRILFSFKLSIGKVAFTGNDIYTNEAIAAFGIRDKNKVDAKYLYYVLKEFDFSGTGDKAVMGLTLNQKKLKLLQIPLPPLETQKKIAAILDKADELRKNDRKIHEKFDQLAKSVFLEMFGDPVLNPKKWELNKFSEVGKLDRGISKHRPRNAPFLLDGPYPLVQTGDIANSDGYVKEFKSTYSEIGLKQSKLWKKGTLCITIAANIAKTGILTFDACFPDSIVGFIPNYKTNSVYVQYWMSFLQKILEESAPESAQKNINLAILRNLDIPIPPVKRQIEFQNVIESINIQKGITRQSLQKSEDLFQSLLQRAFRGELV
jgi:type I restriction enzyme, S subunit